MTSYLLHLNHFRVFRTDIGRTYGELNVCLLSRKSLILHCLLSRADGLLNVCQNSGPCFVSLLIIFTHKHATLKPASSRNILLFSYIFSWITSDEESHTYILLPRLFKWIAINFMIRFSIRGFLHFALALLLSGLPRDWDSQDIFYMCIMYIFTSVILNITHIELWLMFHTS